MAKIIAQSAALCLGWLAGNFTRQKGAHGFRRNVACDKSLTDVADQNKCHLTVAHFFILRHEPHQLVWIGAGALDIADPGRQANGAEMSRDTIGAAIWRKAELLG